MTSSVLAHQRAELVVESPREDERISSDTVELVVTAAGGALSSVDFALRLDGEPVDTSGEVGTGSVFTAFTLAAGSRVRLSVPAGDDGEHELRVVFAADPDNPRADLVRRFETGPGGEFSPVVPIQESLVGRLLLLAGLAGVATLAVLGLRRRRLRRVS